MRNRTTGASCARPTWRTTTNAHATPAPASTSASAVATSSMLAPRPTASRGVMMTARTDRAVPVVSLAAYREAVRAATFLRGCLHEPAWLKEVVVELADGGEPRVAVVLLWHTT